MENIIHENKNSKSTVKRFVIVIYHKQMKIRVIFHKINCKICQSRAILFLLFLMCDLILFLMLILKTATLLITQVKYVKIWTKHTSFRKDFIYIGIINKIFFLFWATFFFNQHFRNKFKFNWLNFSWYSWVALAREFTSSTKTN